MTSKPDTAKEQSNTWTRGGQAKSSDVAATTAKFLMVGQLNESAADLPPRYTTSPALESWAEPVERRGDRVGNSPRGQHEQ